MDFMRYAERSAALVNADLQGPSDLVELLAVREWLHPAVRDRDVLRPVFTASNGGDEDGVVEQLNGLLSKHPVTPHIAGHGTDHRGGGWHMHVADQSSSVSELLVAESLMGLSTLVCDLGATRLGICDAARCEQVFVDTSPNRSRRYCSERCSSRANVAAYRARQRESRVATAG
jgi:predicted RNA-binding Zn ribbon-like protein